MSADGGDWAPLAEKPATATGHVGPVTPGVVSTTFRVRAVNANGAGIAEFVTVTTGGTGRPSAPLNLTAVAAGPTIINLDWDAPSSPVGSAFTYEVQVSADGGVSWGSPQPAVQTSYRHTGLPVGATRHYRVRARNTNGPGPWTPVESATTDAGTPGPPRDLTANADGASVIELDWRAPSDAGGAAVTGYRIEWSANGVIWDVLEPNHLATDYRDDYRLSPGTTRHYRVAAVNRHGQGDWSNEAQGHDEPPTGETDGLTARAQGTSRIELDWTAPTAGGPVTGYWIEWSSTGTGGWTRRVRNSRATSYTDTGLSAGTTRHYRVAAINTAGEGPWSRVVQATTEVSVPGAPTSLTVSPNGLRGSTELRLAWRPPANSGGSPITGYRIEWRFPNSSDWKFVVPGPSGTATTYLHTGLAPNTTRFYRVSAINAQGQGDPTNAVRGTTNAARPGQPRNLRARAAGPTSITLGWEAPASDGGERITGYTIRRRGQRRNLDPDPSQHGSAGDDLHGHGPPAGHRLPVPGGGDQPRGNRPVVVRGEHEHVRPGLPAHRST